MSGRIRLGSGAHKNAHVQQCQHIVVRLEMNSTRIRFKIQNFANLHVPEMRLLKEPVIEYTNGAAFTVYVLFSNRMEHDTHIVLLPDG
jgi:hypothetical protein